MVILIRSTTDRIQTIRNHDTRRYIKNGVILSGKMRTKEKADAK